MKNNYVGGYQMMDIILFITKSGVTGSQPADIVAIKNNIATLIECKNLDNKSGKFPLSRIESNQWLAYKKLKECHNSNMVLSILWDNKIYFVNFDLLQFFNKSIDLKTLEPNIKNWSE